LVVDYRRAGRGTTSKFNADLYGRSQRSPTRSFFVAVLMVEVLTV
jgi:hypothetical protein